MDTTQTNEIIKQLYADKFTIWNVKDKQPILKYGVSWAKCCYDDINIDFNKLEYGIRTGKQENGHYIIGLDFDTYKKEASEYIECKATKQLLSVFEDLNINNEGLFISSTENNRGCLVDATNCEELIKVIEMDGRAKIQKNGFCLEVLTGFNFVIPPTMTICKKRQKALTPRQFLNIDKPILDLKPDSDIYNFIFDYINSSLVKTKINKSVLKKTLNYDCIIEDIKTQQPILKSTPTAYFNHIKQCLLILNPDRVNNYNSWFNISMSLKNCKLLNDTEKYELYKHFSNSGNYTTNEGELKKHWDKWDKYINTPNYEHYNTNYILRLCNYDNPDLFYKLNIEYNNAIKEEEYNKQLTIFNKEVIKILTPAVYLMYNFKNSVWDLVKEEDIKHACNETHGKEFLKRYFDDRNKQYYDYYDFIPMLELTEFKNIIKVSNEKTTFNAFTGYAITKFENPKITNCDNIIKLINELCDNNIKTIEFLIQWMAHLIFNTCKRCFKVPVLKGAEGCGKGTIHEILSRILGHNYTMEENTPSRSFNGFNKNLFNKVLITIQESDTNTLKGCFETFKSLISDTHYNMEAKNKDSVKLRNYMWFMIFTNNNDLFNISTSNRRFYFIECSDKYKNNTGYFSNIYKDMEDDNIIYTFYKYLEGQYNINYDFNKALDEQQTEYHKAICQTSKNPFWLFIEELIHYDEYINDDYIFISVIDMYNKFRDYARTNGNPIGETGQTIKSKLLTTKYVVCDRIQQNGKRQMTYKINRKDLLTYITKKNLI